MKRVILITVGDVLASVACKSLLQDKGENNFEIVAVVDSKMSLLQSVRILGNGIEKGAFFYVLYMLIETYGLVIANYTYYILGLWGIKKGYVTNIFNDFKKRNIPIIKAGNINSYDSIATIKAYDPDVIICVRPAQILRKKFITSFSRILNLHCTLLPKYRGIGGIFQSLVRGENELGCTVYAIKSEKIDFGPIVAQSKLVVDSFSSILHCTTRLYKKAQSLLLKALSSEATTDCMMPQGGDYFNWPVRKDLHKFRSTGRKFFTISDFIFFNK